MRRLVLLLSRAGVLCAQKYKVGRAPSGEEEKAWDISIAPSGKELPAGQGTAAEGKEVPGGVLGSTELPARRRRSRSRSSFCPTTGRGW